jgi:hypothetical protein
VVLFMAPSYASKAKRLGFKETARYWVPFWLTLAGYVAGAVVIAIVLTQVKGYSSSSSSSRSSYTPPTTSAQTYAATSKTNNVFRYPVTQGSGQAQSLAYAIVTGDPHTWGNDDSTYAMSAVCEENTDYTTSYEYNCNIALSNLNGGSYWADWNGYSWDAEYRTAS